MRAKPILLSLIVALATAATSFAVPPQVIYFRDFETTPFGWTGVPDRGQDAAFGNPGRSFFAQAPIGSTFVQLATNNGTVPAATTADLSLLRISVDIYHNDSGPRPFLIEFKNAGGTFNDYNFRTTVTIPSNQWTTVSLKLSDFANQGSGASIAFDPLATSTIQLSTNFVDWVSAPGALRNGWIYPGNPIFNLDNFKYEVIPEPSTYAAFFGALALGLALWRRRRNRA